MKIVATIAECVQVGMDEYKDRNYSKVFDTAQSFDDIINWASAKIKGMTIHTIRISELDEK